MPPLTSFLRLCLITASLLGSNTVAAADKPNILFIYTDDHSYRTLSCYEDAEPWARTPNMDRLAARGVRFTHAYVGTWCMPSRTTQLTGRHQYGVATMRMAPPYPGATYDPEQCRFLPSVLREQGYHTAHIGKWHAGNDAGFGRDWDHQMVWNRPRHPDNAPNYYHDQLISIDGGEPHIIKGYSTDNYTNWAIDYINGRNRSPQKPWYLWLCYGGVHAPYTPADRHLEDYPDLAVPTPADIYPPRPGKPAYMQTIAAWEQGPNGEPVLSDKAIGSEVGDDFDRDRGRSLSAWARQYHQAVRSLDEGIGRVLEALEASGQLENTLVVLTADQGYAWGHHGFRAKLAPYDANIRGPLIISMPGTLPEGKVCRTPVGGADIPPTLFSIAGLDLPWEMHGHDLTPLLQDPQAAWPHTTLLPFTADKFGADCDSVPPPPGNLHKAGVPWYLMVAQSGFKYVRTLQAGEPEELYDLTNDPEELNNLATHPEYAARLRSLRQAAQDELKRTGAKMLSTLSPTSTETAP
jgi:arylsulfatase A-like enzyme